MSNNEKILISACLAGVNCKYNGGNNANEKIKQIISKHDVILVCPEQLGGLTTPRDPAERLGSRVITNKSQDVTENFQRGAEETLRLAKEYNIKKAILKSRSPSCGKCQTYDGTFTNTLVNKPGITADLLSKNGIEIIESDKFI